MVKPKGHILWTAVELKNLFGQSPKKTGTVIYQCIGAVKQNWRTGFPGRPLREFWYAVVEAENREKGYQLAFALLSRRNYTASVDETGQRVPPVAFPLDGAFLEGDFFC